MVHKIQTEEELQLTSHFPRHAQKVGSVTRVNTIKCMLYPGGRTTGLSAGAGP